MAVSFHSHALLYIHQINQHNREEKNNLEITNRHGSATKYIMIRRKRARNKCRVLIGSAKVKVKIPSLQRNRSKTFTVIVFCCSVLHCNKAKHDAACVYIFGNVYIAEYKAKLSSILCICNSIRCFVWG
jgi:hypothetical protein